MSAPQTFEEMLQRAGWREIPRNGHHGVWRCPTECGQHQVSIPRSSRSFDLKSPICKRVAKCAVDLERKRQAALALQSIAGPQPESDPAPEIQPESTLETQPDPQPEREEEPAMAAATTPAQSLPTLLVDGVEVEVIARESALVPRMLDQVLVVSDRVDKVLLADNREVFACSDPGCIYVGATAHGVWVHNGRMHSSKRAVAKKTAQPAPAVAPKPRPKPRPGQQSEPQPVYVPVVQTPPQHTLEDRINGIAHAIDLLTAELRNVAVEAAARPPVDPEVAEKAALYDQLKSLLNR